MTDFSASTQRVIADAVSDCLSAIIKIRGVIHEFDDPKKHAHLVGEIDDLRLTMSALELQAVRLIRQADKDELGVEKKIMLAGSKAVLDAMPISHPTSFLDSDDMREILKWADPEFLEMGRDKGFFIGRGMSLLIDHAPDDDRWTDLVCNSISPNEILSSADGLPIAYSYDIALIKHKARLAAALRAQVRDHKDNMDEYLMGCLTGRSEVPSAAVALYLAGARIPEDWNGVEVTKGMRQLADAMRSHHGALKIIDTYGSLEDLLRNMAARNSHEIAVEFDRA